MKQGVDFIISSLSEYISEERIAHTIGVYNTARWLGSIFLPERIDELSVAALLHDLAKELRKEDLIALISSTENDLREEDLETYPALHSFAGAPFAKQEFPEFVNNDILSAIFNHTLGNPGMSLFDKIIFLSDYIEEGRPAKECKEVREYLASAIGDNEDDNIRALHTAIVMSIEFTEKYIISKGLSMNSRSLKFKESILDKSD